jgi:UDP-glucose:(heptosyl)LPS alpha-1,3-glucosyltransferase
MVKQEILSLFQIDEKKIHVIYNGIDTQKFRPPSAEEKIQARHDLNVSDDMPLMVFLGAGFERKGLKHLLHALALAPYVRLLVVGHDKHIKRYEALAQAIGVLDRVVFAGPQKNPMPYLWAADAMVFPTLYDPCPNAVLEGMACGLGIISTPHCGAMELLDDEAGICVSPWDHAAMANAMVTFSQPDRARRAGLASRACVEALTLKNMGQQLLELYQSLVDKH